MNNKNNRKANHKRRARLRPEALVIIAFCLSTVFYCFTKIGLNAYNITLSNEEQKYAAQVSKKQDAINDLEAEVNKLQDKSRVLGLLEGDVKDNQNNIYVID